MGFGSVFCGLFWFYGFGSFWALSLNTAPFFWIHLVDMVKADWTALTTEDDKKPPNSYTILDIPLPQMPIKGVNEQNVR